MMDTATPLLVLVRGLPGSGKSTLAKLLVLAGFEHYEADMHHMKGDTYCFNPDNAKTAHAWCQAKAREALLAGRPVVVSNTFTRLWEMQPYLDMAAEAGVTPNIVEAKGAWQNTHGVPVEVMNSMRGRWEAFPEVAA